ncbi:adenylate/guanylate cyclase domain-containing protein [bacterium]|nr:MAG: adenylate/guanylate cyclase domain-containing protein [bacterium]
MSMFARLFLLLGLVSSISLGGVAALLWRNSLGLRTELQFANEEAGDRVRKNGSELVINSLKSTHLMIVSEKARKVQSYFSGIVDAVELEAALTRQFLSDESATTDAPRLFEANDLTRRALAEPWLRKSYVAVQPYSIYHLTRGVSERQTRAQRNRLRRLGTFFAHTQHNVPGCDSSYFGSEQGFIQGYPGGKTFFKDAYDPRKRPWYTAVVDPEQRPGAINWIVYTDRDGKTLFLTCSRTVTLAGEKKPAGVAAIDVKWPHVVLELFNVGALKVSKAILVDSSGLVQVSADYNSAKPNFNTKSALDTPLAASLPGFSSVMNHIRSHRREAEGIYWEGREKNAPMDKARDLFLYATIRLTEAGKSSSTIADDRWRYIVRLPMKSLLQPSDDMSRQIKASTSEISSVIGDSTRSSTFILLLSIGATLSVALGVAYFAARATSRPLIQMAEVARGVGQGNLDQQAIETSGGEIGDMGRAINAMISGLRQRNLLQETFGRYTAPSVVEEVLRRGGVQLGGVKSNATIFFSDLVGFTALSERTEPELLVTLLNEYFDAMTKVILGSEGTLDKYIGDAILAFWGHPIAHEDDAARACRAALEQREQLSILCDKWHAQGYPRLDMRIGIETGEVIVGDVGSELKLNYTVLGDTVNLASRLESLNKAYGTRILIGETTRQLAGSAIEVREIDLLAVVGKSRPVHVYELLGMTGTLPPEKLSSYHAYEHALHAYHDRRWDEAEAYLMRVLRELGPDKPSEVLLDRIEHHRHNPPPPDWDGSSVLTQK